ncbi:hypothetical protein F5148DRAFT_1219796, partial [Russula earlei]
MTIKFTLTIKTFHMPCTSDSASGCMLITMARIIISSSVRSSSLSCSSVISTSGTVRPFGECEHLQIRLFAFISGSHRVRRLRGRTIEVKLQRAVCRMSRRILRCCQALAALLLPLMRLLLSWQRLRRGRSRQWGGKRQGRRRWRRGMGGHGGVTCVLLVLSSCRPGDEVFATACGISTCERGRTCGRGCDGRGGVVQRGACVGSFSCGDVVVAGSDLLAGRHCWAQVRGLGLLGQRRWWREVTTAHRGW